MQNLSYLNTSESHGPQKVFALFRDVVEFPLEQVYHRSPTIDVMGILVGLRTMAALGLAQQGKHDSHLCARDYPR